MLITPCMRRRRSTPLATIPLLSLWLCLLVCALAAAQPKNTAAAATPAPLGRQAGAEAKKPAVEDDDDSDRKPNQSAHTTYSPRAIPAAAFGDRLDLTSAWLFQGSGGGDYSSPTLNDADWSAIDTATPLSFNGLFNLNEIWYRAHVRLAPGSRDLALTIADFGGSYRVYVNGLELGGHGRMAGRGDYLVSRSATYPIPPQALGRGELVIVIHAFVGAVDRAAFTFQDGIHHGSAVYLGPANTLWRDQLNYFLNGMTENAAILTLWTVLLLLAGALSFLIPRVAAYPLLAVYAGGHLMGRLLMDYSEFHYLAHTHWLTWPTTLLMVLSELAALEFCRMAAGARRGSLFIAFEVFYAFTWFSLAPAALGWMNYLVYGALTRVSSYLLLTVLFALIALGMRRHRQDANVLGAVIGLYLFYVAAWKLLQYVVFNYSFLTRLADAFIDKLRPALMGDFAIVIGFLTVVLVRTLRIVRERASIANEIEAARTMQQLLLARSNQATPGFLVESAYLPAGEVGGDFFLVSPCTAPGQEPSLTVIVGDVSGKGLRAAMRVSMILGVLRREPSREPAAMLAGLNQALADEGDTGFTTACCVRVSADGRFTAANAGHINPYIAGRELVISPALPLGLAGGETYELFDGRLLPGQKLVLMSDGIAEARNHRGELYGFDRLGALTLRPATEIAGTAKSFGQEDDITVLTIACTPRTTSLPPPPVPPARSAAPPPPRLS